MEYTVIRKKVKNINLRVGIDGKVTVSANNSVPLDYIEQFVMSKMQFILNAQQKISKTKKQGYDYGSYISFFGYKFMLCQSQKPVKQAYVQDDCLYAYGDNPQKMVEQWYKKQCEIVLMPYVKKWFDAFGDKLKSFPVVKFRCMKSRWGSCKPKGSTITLNTCLADYPIQAAEYVIVHELAHFLQPNHSPLFYREIENVMPYYKQYKALLKERM